MMGLIDRRRALMMQAKEETPSDISSFADTTAATVSVENNVFTFKYTSSGRGIYRTIPLTLPLSLNTDDVFVIRFLDAVQSVKVKGSGLVEKTLSSGLSWTLTGNYTLTSIQFATTASSGTDKVTRCQVLINDDIVIGNDFS